MNDIKPAAAYLKNHCLADLALKFDEVAELFYNARLDGARWTQRLCMSHERLRAELSGAEILIGELKAEIELWQGMKEGFTVRATDYETRIAELEQALKAKTVIHNQDGSFWCPSCGHDSRNTDEPNHPVRK